MISVSHTGASVLIIYFTIQRKIVQLCTSHTKLSQMSPQATCPFVQVAWRGVCALFRLIGYPPISSYRLSPLYTMHRIGYPSIPLKARFVSSEGTSWSSNPLQHAGEKRTLAQIWKPLMFQTHFQMITIHQIL